jgi:hypothetical protein
MDLTKVLAQLRQELNHVDAAILSLERLQARGAARRGRPPRSLLELRKLKPQTRKPGSRSRQSGSGGSNS